MATKKLTLTPEQAYRKALLNLADLGFAVDVQKAGDMARIRHPLAATLPPGTEVETTKILYSSYKERIEVDGKRVALGEVLDRAVAASLGDVNQARNGLEYARKQGEKKTERYEAFCAAGLDTAAKGMPYAKKYSTIADRLVAEGDGLTVQLEAENTEKPLVLTITAHNGSVAALVAALKAVRKAAKV